MKIEIRKTMQAIFISVALLACGGCEIVGAVLSKTTGPDSVDAEYVPPQEPMLVLVESWGNAGSVGADSERLSAALVKELKDNKVAPLVDPNKLESLRDADSGTANMPITDLGRKLGAKQVLYVNVEIGR